MIKHIQYMHHKFLKIILQINIYYYLLVGIIFVLTGCTSDISAPIEYGNKKVVVRKYTEKSFTDNNINYPKKNIEYSNDQINENKNIIYHEVIANDTIESIAKKYCKTPKELIEFNELPPPYRLEPLQLIQIKSNNKHNTCNTNLTLAKPVDGRIVKNFDDKDNNGSFEGLVFLSPDGAVVKSSIDGKVIYKGYDTKFGNIIIIEKGIYQIAYGYMKDISVNENDHVLVGEKIGFVGNIPGSKNSGIYMALRKEHRPIDPLQYF